VLEGSHGGTARAHGARRLLRCAAAIGLLAVLGALGAWAQDEGPGEYPHKATFLAQFPNFIEWPESAFAEPKSSFLICVFGNFSFGTSLAQATANGSFHGRKLEVRWMKRITDVRACQILFVSRSEAGRYGPVLGAARNAGILTVGETRDFLGAGGAICFSYDADILRFEVNLAATKEARLTISARLLALAKHVWERPEGARG
jgi:hypothetical protein